MRLIGNKTHGDLAEIAISEFINQFMYDFRSEHVGKTNFRRKDHEEDIKVINEITKEHILISLKAYGHGPLQLSTDKNNALFPLLTNTEKDQLKELTSIKRILSNEAFGEIKKSNILPIIYEEKEFKVNILIFNFEKAYDEIARIEKIESGKGRKHPVYTFFNKDGKYINPLFG